MVIVVISTFRDCSEAGLFYTQNLAFLQRQNVRWVYSLGQREIKNSQLEALPRMSNISKVVQPDSSYAEGWNNSLARMIELGWQENALVCFLGDGDTFLQMPDCISTDDKGVLVGKISRHGKVEAKKPSSRMLSFASIRCWTPACLFPASLFSEFRFPESTNVASDVDLFFEINDRGYQKQRVDDFVVAMDTTGLSSSSSRGISEYCDLYEERYGTSYLARIAKVLKLSKYYLRRSLNG